VRETRFRISDLSFNRISGSPERIIASESSGLSKAIARLRAIGRLAANFSFRPVKIPACRASSESTAAEERVGEASLADQGPELGQPSATTVDFRENGFQLRLSCLSLRRFRFPARECQSKSERKPRKAISNLSQRR
jgi:hypothetical protein